MGIIFTRFTWLIFFCLELKENPFFLRIHHWFLFFFSSNYSEFTYDFLCNFWLVTKFNFFFIIQNFKFSFGLRIIVGYFLLKTAIIEKWSCNEQLVFFLKKIDPIEYL